MGIDGVQVRRRWVPFKVCCLARGSSTWPNAGGARWRDVALSAGGVGGEGLVPG